MVARELIACMLAAIFAPAVGLSQQPGVLRGRVTLYGSGTPLHNVSVTILQLRLTTETDDNGEYEFRDLLPGTYRVLTHLEGVPDLIKTVEVVPGQVTTLDFQIQISGIKEQVTVTATGNELSTFEAFQSVSSLDNIQLTERGQVSIGELLENQPGVAKRSFGPGSSVPVIRGFSGDRVLILEDGIQTGSLSSSSGDHGEPISTLDLERLEVIKGPAALLYGNNAIGGIVNAVTGHEQEHPHQGVRGYLTGLLGTTNNQAGSSGGFEFGTEKWLMWLNGTLQRTGDYDTPIGEIQNSRTRSGSASAGFGRFSDKKFFSFDYGYDASRYGVPFAGRFEEGDEEVSLKLRKHSFKFTAGMRDLGSFFDGFRLSLNYTDYEHKELEGGSVGTRFENKQFVYRGVFDQRGARKRLSGSFGFWGLRRDFNVSGPEALAPPADQNAFALFSLQEINLDRVSFQLGGRLEYNGYNPRGLPERNFTVFSGAAGIKFPLWRGGAFVANYSHSRRAPALEELYNEGPHIGNLTFEVGNPDLKSEKADGIDLSLRQASGRIRAEASFFYYGLRDFIFLAPTGEVQENLPVAEYRQADARYLGAEISLDLAVRQWFWIRSGVDYVDAELRRSGISLPRIPPLRGRFGLDIRYKGLQLNPEAVVARDQDALFPTETRTPGYALFNLVASYAIARQHAVQIFSVNAFNLSNRLYRNHLSFIKDLAPEIGRGVRFTYTVRFF
jgi:iron complex outermembrane receptor protein